MTEKATPRPWMWAWRDDENAPASIFSMVREGHAYAIAMCPRYQKPEQWVADAKLIIEAVNSYDAAQATIADLNWIINRVAVSPAAIESAREERRRMNLEAVTRPARMGFKRAQRLGQVAGRGGGKDSAPRIGTPIPFRNLLLSIALTAVPAMMEAAE